MMFKVQSPDSDVVQEVPHSAPSLAAYAVSGFGKALDELVALGYRIEHWIEDKLVDSTHEPDLVDEANKPAADEPDLVDEANKPATHETIAP
jgi:hypothetical protein